MSTVDNLASKISSVATQGVIADSIKEQPDLVQTILTGGVSGVLAEQLKEGVEDNKIKAIASKFTMPETGGNTFIVQPWIVLALLCASTLAVIQLMPQPKKKEK